MFYKWYVINIMLFLKLKKKISEFYLDFCNEIKTRLFIEWYVCKSVFAVVVVVCLELQHPLQTYSTCRAFTLSIGAFLPGMLVLKPLHTFPLPPLLPCLTHGTYVLLYFRESRDGYFRGYKALWGDIAWLHPGLSVLFDTNTLPALQKSGTKTVS